jgi:hypothetical protein
MFSVGGVFREDQSERWALFDHRKLTQILRRWLTGVLIDQAEIMGTIRVGERLRNAAFARMVGYLTSGLS